MDNFRVETNSVRIAMIRLSRWWERKWLRFKRKTPVVMRRDTRDKIFIRYKQMAEMVNGDRRHEWEAVHREHVTQMVLDWVLYALPEDQRHPALDFAADQIMSMGDDFHKGHALDLVRQLSRKYEIGVVLMENGRVRSLRWDEREGA